MHGIHFLYIVLIYTGKRRSMNVETDLKHDEKIWIKFLRNHWKMLVVFIVGVIVASIGAILVYLWFVGEAQLTNLVPATLGLWTMGHFVTFLLHLIFWEALFIGIPVLLAIGAVIFLWWKKISYEERKEYRRGHLIFGTGSRRSDSSGGISFLVFIAFIIKIFMDGNWDVPFATWEFEYLVYSCLWAFIWVVIIIGIPMLIGGIWWLRHEMNKTS
jgi:hypothetical protein